MGIISGVKNSPQNADYIEIKHVGPEEAMTRPLFISDRTVSIRLNSDSVTINNQRAMFSGTSEQIILSHKFYNSLLTDSNTLKKAMFFITQHQSLLIKTFEPRKPHGVEFLIVVNGKFYKISHKMEDDFFAGLINFLKAEKCNRNSVAALKSSLKTVCHLYLK